MKPITFKGNDYDLCITFGSIELQSTDRDFIFENGYNKVCAQLEKEWYQQGAFGNLKDYIYEYDVEAICQYVKDHEAEAIEIIHQNN